MFTTTHFSKGRWYLECHIIFTPSSEVEYQKLFEGFEAIDLEVDEFVGLIDCRRGGPLRGGSTMTEKRKLRKKLPIA